MTTAKQHWYRRLPQLVLVALCVALILAVAVAGVSTAAPFATYNADWTGTTDLRNTALSGENTTVVIDSSVTRSPAATATTTAFVLGVPDETTDIESTAAAVLAGGGTVVVTDEVPTTTNTFLETLGATARVNRGPVRDPQSYHRQPVLPIVTTTNATGELADTEVTLNHAGTLAPGEATVLAKTSQFAYIDRNRNGQFDAEESLAARPVMTRESVDNGTIVVISDSSVFINAMYERDGNRALAEWMYSDADTLVMTGAAVRPLPRLVAGLLWAKSTPVSQTALLTAAAGVILLVSRKRYRTAVMKNLRRDESADISQTMAPHDHPSSNGASRPIYESGLMSLLRRKYPEWDQDTLRRLVTAARMRQYHSGGDRDTENSSDE